MSMFQRECHNNSQIPSRVLRNIMSIIVEKWINSHLLVTE